MIPRTIDNAIRIVKSIGEEFQYQGQRIKCALFHRHRHNCVGY